MNGSGNTCRCLRTRARAHTHTHTHTQTHTHTGRRLAASGGNGADGGDVILRAARDARGLRGLPRVARGGSGGHGRPNNRRGAQGETRVYHVPVRMCVYEHSHLQCFSAGLKCVSLREHHVVPLGPTQHACAFILSWVLQL